MLPACLLNIHKKEFFIEKQKKYKLPHLPQVVTYPQCPDRKPTTNIEPHETWIKHSLPDGIVLES